MNATHQAVAFDVQHKISCCERVSCSQKILLSTCILQNVSGTIDEPAEVSSVSCLGNGTNWIAVLKSTL